MILLTIWVLIITVLWMILRPKPTTKSIDDLINEIKNIAFDKGYDAAWEDIPYLSEQELTERVREAVAKKDERERLQSVEGCCQGRGIVCLTTGQESPFYYFL